MLAHHVGVRVTFFVDVLYDLHNLAVGTFSVLPADLSLVHKFLFRKLIFEVSRLLSNFSAFATFGFLDFRVLLTWIVRVCHSIYIGVIRCRSSSLIHLVYLLVLCVALQFSDCTRDVLTNFVEFFPEHFERTLLHNESGAEVIIEKVRRSKSYGEVVNSLCLRERERF